MAANEKKKKKKRKKMKGEELISGKNENSNELRAAQRDGVAWHRRRIYRKPYVFRHQRGK